MENSTDIVKVNGESTGGVTTFDYGMRMASLTPEERTHYLEVAKKIDTNDVNSVLRYGNEISSTIAQNGDSLLTAVKGSNSSEVIELTNNLLSELNLIDIDEFTDANKPFKRFLSKVPIVRHFVKSYEQLKIKYDSVSDNVNKISRKIGATRLVAMRDNAMLETMFDNNRDCIEQLRTLILAAKCKIEEIDNDIKNMMADPMNHDQIEIKDMQDFRNMLAKRVADMQTSEYILFNNLLQIRAIQSNNTAIADKADIITNHTIPVWKNQLAIAVVMNNQKSSIEAQKKLSDATNQILQKNAANLKQNSIEVAKASEEQVVKIETLQKVTTELVETLTEVRRIHDEGKKNRENLEKQLADFGQTIEKTLLSGVAPDTKKITSSNR